MCIHKHSINKVLIPFQEGILPSLTQYPSSMGPYVVGEDCVREVACYRPTALASEEVNASVCVEEGGRRGGDPDDRAHPSPRTRE